MTGIVQPKRFRADPCPQCGATTEHVGRYDRFACKACDIWTDEACGCTEEKCPFEAAPERPSKSG